MLASLRVRLLVPVLVAAVPIFAIVVASGRQQRRVLEEQAKGEATSLAQLVAERHQRSVDVARGVLLAVAQMRAVAALDGDGCSAALAPLLVHEPVFVNVGAVRADGRVFCSAAPLRGAYDLSDRPFYREALRTGGLGVGEYVVSRIRGFGALGFAYPVADGAGGVTAVAFASLSTDRLQRDLDALPLPPGAEVAVLDRAGVTLSARPDGARWAGRPYDPRRVAEIAAAGRPVALRGGDGVERVYAVQQVTAPDGRVAMRILAGLPLAAVLEPVNRVWTRALLGALLATALAVAAAVLIAELGIARRLRRLAEASRRLAAGDREVRTGLPRRGDEIAHLAGSFDDMADALAALDREKRQREEQLAQAQRLEAVGQLAGGVAHDFNNLLTVILSAGAALRERIPPGHPGQEDAREILFAGERAAALTRQLLSFSRRQPLAPRVFDLGEAAAGMQRLLRRLLGEGVALTVEARAPAPILADPSQLEMALLNLAVNARDAMPDGGRLEVEVRTLDRDHPGRPAGDDVPEGPLAVLEVRDTGHGMDEATRARIFEPFFTTKGPGRGTGLGLPIVLGVVAAGDGALRVDSAPGRGTTFRIYLPLHAAEGARAEPPAREAPRGSETVLVVEDDPHVRFVVRRTLEGAGYRVLEAEAAAEALALARAGDEEVDLVVSDVVLPDGNGLDLAADLAADWPGVGLLFISGYAGEHLASLHALPAEARLLSKPFTGEVLLLRVREALDARPGVMARSA